MTAGFAVVEALVALVLAAIAVAALTAVAGVGGHHVRLARERGIAIALASDRLDALRAGPRDSGSDAVVVAGTRYTREWSSTGGRGLPVHLEVEVTWDGGHAALASDAFP